MIERLYLTRTNMNHGDHSSEKTDLILHVQSFEWNGKATNQEYEDGNHLLYLHSYTMSCYSSEQKTCGIFCVFSLDCTQISDTWSQFEGCVWT